MAAARRRSAIRASRRNASWERAVAAISVTVARATARIDSCVRLLTTSTPRPAAVANVDTARAAEPVVERVSCTADSLRRAVLSTHIAMRAIAMAHPASSGVPAT